MSETNERDVVIAEHDGIEEYDNPLPKWWLYMFYASIVFAFCHFGYYLSYQLSFQEHSSKGTDVRAYSDVRLKLDIEANKIIDNVDYANLSGEELIATLKKQTIIARGASVFQTNCVACHGNQGQGGVGANLVDNYWLHGNKPEEIIKSVDQGFPEKGMPGWGTTLGRKNVISLAAYVISIRGNEVANPKAPQGDLLP
jgi:cytochrome c oxidase cbb3-type subunit 3